jgi:hypothetical protein
MLEMYKRWDDKLIVNRHYLWGNTAYGDVKILFDFLVYVLHNMGGGNSGTASRFGFFNATTV